MWSKVWKKYFYTFLVSLSQEIYEAYQKEASIKRIILENVAHNDRVCKNVTYYSMRLLDTNTRLYNN